MVKFFILFLSTVIYINNAYTYDWVACRREQFTGRPLLWIGASTISSTQFISSWGGCSAIRSRADTKKSFLSDNLENMKNESSKGRGQFIETYALLSGCHKNDKELFLKRIQENYPEVFGSLLEKQDKDVYESIEKLIKNDSQLSANCKI